MKNNKLKIISNIFVLFIFEILFIIFNLSEAPSVSAQELSVSIDPPLIQIEAKAPALVKTPITIQNESDQNITYSIFLLPFKAGSEKNGQVEFDKNLIEKYKDIFGKIQILDQNRSLTQITLAPKQKKDLTLSIRVLKDEKPIDYYFSVIFISEAIENLDQDSFVGARAGIGTNVLLSIGPKSQTQGYIKEFSAPKFVDKGPVKFKLNIANTSRHYVSIKGNLIIKNIFGQAVGNIDLAPVNILGRSERFIEGINWNEKFLLGIYKADLTVTLSEQGPILKRSLTFFAFPAEAILGIIVAMILVVGIIKRARSKETD